LEFIVFLCLLKASPIDTVVLVLTANSVDQHLAHSAWFDFRWI